jgi:hypothetical protein
LHAATTHGAPSAAVSPNPKYVKEQPAGAESTVRFPVCSSISVPEVGRWPMNA